MYMQLKRTSQPGNGFSRRLFVHAHTKDSSILSDVVGYTFH